MTFSRTRFLPALVGALCAMLAGAAAFVLDGIEQDRSEAALQNRAADLLLAQVERLEAVLASRVFLVEGLAALVQIEPALGHDAFVNYARHLVGGRSGVRNLGIAPGGVITDVF